MSKPSTPPAAIRKLLASDAEVFIRAGDAGRAIADALKIPRLDAMRLMWDAQRAGDLKARIIHNETCVDIRHVRSIIKTWRAA